MAANPNPARISAAMWEFIEALEALEPADTEYAGSWGDWKPGYHADRNTLLKNPAWRNDYSIRLPADKLGPGAMGAANDWTFRSAQAGNFTNIRKYGDRVRKAFLTRDPRLHGWREVLCQGDSDAAADGYDFVSWTERTPDSTHTWHFHFSKLRQFIEDRDSYQAMLSILRGETLAQWQAKGDDDMFFYFQLEDQSAGRANGCTYEYAPSLEKLMQWQAKCPAPTKKVARADLEAGLYGVNVATMVNVAGSGGFDLTAVDVAVIAEREARAVVSGTTLVPPSK